MRIFATVIFLGFAALASAKECHCPAVYTALLEGKSVVTSGTRGQIHVPECCKGTTSWGKGDVKTKKTPGTACSAVGDCGTCTLMDFCRWGGAAAGKSCQDVNHIDPDDLATYSNQCSSKGEMGNAELIDLKTDSANVPQKAAASMTEKPEIDKSDGQWPGMFEGYLPPAECVRSNEVGKTSACAQFKKDNVAFIYPQNIA